MYMLSFCTRTQTHMITLYIHERTYTHKHAHAHTNMQHPEYLAACGCTFMTHQILMPNSLLQGRRPRRRRRVRARARCSSGGPLAGPRSGVARQEEEARISPVATDTRRACITGSNGPEASITNEAILRQYDSRGWRP